ncbi:MAG: hypothetical protein ACT4QC_15685 [Planctomycetaceae bacterium]
MLVHLWGLIFSLGLLPAAHAQLPAAKLFAIHPGGGQRGTTLQIGLTSGADLDDVSQLYFSHPGITAVLATEMVEGQPQPVAGQFVVTIGPEVPLGAHDVRARGRYGLSNARSFTVGDRKELVEAEPNNGPEQAMPIALETVVNGRSDAAADLDWFKLPLAAGQRVIIALRSSRLDSRMEGVLELYRDAKRLARRQLEGRQEPLLDFTAPAEGDYLLKVHDFVYGGGAEYIYRLTVTAGPQIDFILPASGIPGSTGEYSLFGRNLPGAQPSEVRAADGQLLEKLPVQIALVADPTALSPGESASPDEGGVDGVAYRLAGPAGTSNPVMIHFATAPTQLEREPNGAATTAQPVTAPVEITGQFQERGDVDVYRFDARAGDVFWVEVFGQRGGSNADPVLAIDQVKSSDAEALSLARITTLDDNPTNIGGVVFNTLSDDPAFRLHVQADGAYLVTVRDRAPENNGDPSLIYRLSIRHESPDFRLAALPTLSVSDPVLQQLPADLALRRGDSAQLSLMVFRRDGFAGPIDVTAEGLPAGVSSTGALISANQNTGTLVLCRQPTPPTGTAPFAFWAARGSTTRRRPKP